MKTNLLKQFILLCKWTFRVLLVQVFFVGMLQAYNGAAQTPKSVNEVQIDLQVSKAVITEVFKEIESKTNYRFIYDDRVIDRKLRISMARKNATVYEVLLEIS